jgi:two-component system, OmpR family, sensor histidine kinase NblS
VAIRTYVAPENPEILRVEISDTGIGIAPEDQSAIFDRFFRVENRVHTLEGTGLGLSIVRNIIDKHHSQIHLISEDGVGTTFWFDLVVHRAIEDVSLSGAIVAGQVAPPSHLLAETPVL